MSPLNACERSCILLPLALLSAICAGCGSGASNSTVVTGFTKVYTFGQGGISNAVAVSPTGNVYLTSQDAKQPPYLAVYSDFGKGQETILSVPTNAIIDGPVFVSPLNGDIYGTNGGQILAFSPSLQHTTTFQEPQTATYYSPYVDGLVVDSKGNVYEVDGYNIAKFDSAGTYLATIAVNAVGIGDADDIAIDSSDNLYVSTGYTVAKFSASGKMLEQFTCSSIAGDEGSIAVDGAGNIYTGSESSGTVVEYSPSGTVKAVQSGLSAFIAVDINGNVYTANGLVINVYHSTGS